MYDETELEAVRQALPDYLARVHGITNLRRGFRCLSPAHEDRHPSMGFYIWKDGVPRVKCHACGAGGDIFDVAAMDNGLDVGRDFGECVEAAAAGAGLVLRGQARSGREAREKGRAGRAVARAKPERSESEPGLPDVSDGVIHAYERLVSEEAAAGAREYLLGRGFTLRDCNAYGFGWCEHPGEVMPGRFDYAPKDPRGYICIPFPTGPGSEGYGCVEYCVIRPLFDWRGGKELKPKGVPGRLWCPHALDSHVAYVAEGPFDAMALNIAMHGREKKTCGLCGKDNVGLMLEHLEGMPEGSRPSVVKLCLDSDGPGRDAAEKAIEELKLLGIRGVAFNAYPAGCKDPNDWLMKANGGAPGRLDGASWS